MEGEEGIEGVVVCLNILDILKILNKQPPPLSLPHPPSTFT
jgi:hypothetical protein